MFSKKKVDKGEAPVAPQDPPKIKQSSAASTLPPPHEKTQQMSLLPKKGKEDNGGLGGFVG